MRHILSYSSSLPLLRWERLLYGFASVHSHLSPVFIRFKLTGVSIYPAKVTVSGSNNVARLGSPGSPSHVQKAKCKSAEMLDELLKYVTSNDGETDSSDVWHVKGEYEASQYSAKGVHLISYLHYKHNQEE